MLEVSNVALPLDAGLPGSETLIKSTFSSLLKISPKDIVSLKLIKRSVDARKKSNVHFVCSYCLEFSSPELERRILSTGNFNGCNVKQHQGYSGFHIQRVEPLDKSPVVIGDGPAGMFCAWALAKAGLKPRIIERGSCVEDRMRQVSEFNNGGSFNPESNIQFGEGGAGTFSDGKLTTGIKNPFCSDVLHQFVACGAPEEILWQAKPHIGTDELVSVVGNMRREIESLGGVFYFDTCVSDFEFEDGILTRVCAHSTRGDVDFDTSVAVLATGHSARDIFQKCKDLGFPLERKPFSVGVRIEHPQSYINALQYGSFAKHPALGAADYKLACHLRNGRGVYTFCMCPGGQVVCAASEESGVVVNGMSVFKRDGANANAAVLVGIEPEDLPGSDPLEGIRFQREIEHKAFIAAGKSYKAPAQRLGDFLGIKSGKTHLKVHPTYARGVEWVDLHQVLPEFVSDSLENGFAQLDRKLPGFSHPDAILTGVETRSSSPVRIVRGSDCQVRITNAEGSGIYPCGEGAGYAGGIMSAAVDGLRVASAIVDPLSFK